MQHLATLAPPRKGAVSPPIERTVSLNRLQEKIRETLSQSPEKIGTLRLDGLTDLRGYRWSSLSQDIELIGLTEEGGIPILVDQFVTALRLAKHPMVGMSLQPKDFAEMEEMHEVIVFPEEAKDSLFIKPLIQADYLYKGLSQGVVKAPHLMDSVAYHREEMKRNCEEGKMGPEPSSQSLQHAMSGNSFFAPAKPELAFTETSDGFIVWIRKADVFVKTQDPLNHPDSDAFDSDFNRKIALVRQHYPIFVEMANMFKLFLLSQLLRAEKIPYDFDFWLREYPLNLHPTPRELPGFEPVVLQWVCWTPPYNYEGVIMRRELKGGMFLDYQESVF